MYTLFIIWLVGYIICNILRVVGTGSTNPCDIELLLWPLMVIVSLAMAITGFVAFCIYKTCKAVSKLFGSKR